MVKQQLQNWNDESRVINCIDFHDNSVSNKTDSYKGTPKVKEESEKVGLKLNIQKTKVMASGPITSWEIDVETVADFILGGSKITADGDCSQEIKRHSLEGKLRLT